MEGHVTCDIRYFFASHDISSILTKTCVSALGPQLYSQAMLYQISFSQRLQTHSCKYLFNTSLNDVTTYSKTHCQKCLVLIAKHFASIAFQIKLPSHLAKTVCACGIHRNYNIRNLEIWPTTNMTRLFQKDQLPKTVWYNNNISPWNIKHFPLNEIRQPFDHNSLCIGRSWINRYYVVIFEKNIPPTNPYMTMFKDTLLIDDSF